MQAGIASRVWELADVVRLIDSLEAENAAEAAN
jgi:hypothetical protein